MSDSKQKKGMRNVYQYNGEFVGGCESGVDIHQNCSQFSLRLLARAPFEIAPYERGSLKGFFRV